jgi:hypothetical protein
MSRRVTVNRTKKRFLSTATLCGILAVAMLGSAGSASAAPPGFSGPFTATCKGYKAGEDLLGIGNAKVEWWRDNSGSGTVCARTSDNMSGSHWLGVRLGRDDWTTTFTDSGNYSTYAGVIYVSMANLHNYDCASVIGWLETSDDVYSSRIWRVC